ncbi:hypothetical protein ACFSE1_08150 [Rhizobium helianthi]|uniref:Transmembrane protein n=1 Tax=Rhizobium helianthi TaxID=1132695 RepID=A0ABW4M478_9HYPH
MFLDLKNYNPKPEPPRQEPARPNLTVRQQKLLAWIICFNVLLLLVAPIGGATAIQGILSLIMDWGQN